MEDLKADDTKKRVAAVKSLDKIAEALGAEKTRQQVLPFLKEYEDEEEEVLLELAGQFGFLAQFLGEGGALEVLPYYYLLLGYEDASVVAEGFRSLEALLRPTGLCHEAVMNLVKKLIALNTLRSLCSASRLCAQFSAAIPARFAAEVSRVLTENAGSRHCLVRKETALHLRHVLQEGHAQEPTGAALLKKLVKDPQDTVKVAVLDTLTSRPLPKAYFAQNWAALVTAHLESKCWKVRAVLAANLPHVFASTAEAGHKALVPAFLRLVNDPEPEVSMQAVETMRHLSELMGQGGAGERLFAEIRPLAAAEDVESKRLLGASLPALAPVAVSEAAQEAFREVVAGLLKDESSEVKVTLLSNIAPMGRVYSQPQLLSVFLPPVLDMLNDKSWKVRKDAVAALQHASKGTGEALANNEKVLKLLKERLSDRVYEVRVTAVRTIQCICRAVPDWAAKQGLPLIAGFAANPNYLYRVNYLWALADMAEQLPLPTVLKEAETVAKLARDPVPNIRLQACLTLFKLHRKLEEKAIEEKIVQVLKEFEGDADSDIQRLLNKPAGSSFRHVYSRLVEQQAI